MKQLITIFGAFEQKSPQQSFSKDNLASAYDF